MRHKDFPESIKIEIEEGTKNFLQSAYCRVFIDVTR